jgi:plastocyanin
MDDATIFYICGGALAVSAVAVSFIGLRVERFPGRFGPLVALWFIALIGTATTFAVLNGKDEEKARASELTKASEEAEEEEASPVEIGSGGASGKAKPETAAKGPGGTLQLAADPSKLAFDTTTLTSKPGKVTIDFSNPATLEHDVAIEQNGKQIAVSETIGKGKTSVTADLAPGTYTFLCTVPGHAEAGMEGTLEIK